MLGIGLLAVLLVGLNAVSLSQKEKQPDSEMIPNRSTYNVGATGTRAFFDLLAETGRQPMRWTEPPSALLADGGTKPSTFVIVGQTRMEISEEETAQILKWVSTGGRLVVIDRAPPEALVETTANWTVAYKATLNQPFFDTDPSDQQQMTLGMKAARAVQPSVYTKNVNGVQPSVFATSIDLEYLGAGDGAATVRTGAARPALPSPLPTLAADQDEYDEPPPSDFATPAPPLRAENSGNGGGLAAEETADEPEIVVRRTPVREAPPAAAAPPTAVPVETAALDAPVVHLAADNRNLLVDVPYGSGRIVFLTDPYIVANGGISLVDNSTLAVNLVSAAGGVIAFDEYHHGYGANQNRLLQYFAGTPVIPVILQIVALVGLILFSQSRRFARPLPETEPDRLSKLEYVAAMAELQQRTKAFDLAIENIYADFRRRVARLVGVDNFTTRREELARLVAERLPGERAEEIERTMRRCEDVMHGDRSNQKEVLQLAARLREIEEKLGLQRRKKGK